MCGQNQTLNSGAHSFIPSYFCESPFIVPSYSSLYPLIYGVIY